MLEPNQQAPTPRLLRFENLLEAWETEVEAAYEARLSNRKRGPETGFVGLDDELGGTLAQGAHIMHGGPGTGKTGLLLQIGATCGTPSLLVTCEMSPLELFRRHIARSTGTFLGRLKAGELEPSEAKDLARRAVLAAPYLTIVDATQSFVSLEWLLQAAQVTRGEGEHLLIGLDSIHAWADGAPGDAPEYERISAAVDAMRTLAAALACPVLAVAERNRASMDKGGLSAGAGSRKLEYSAESVWDLQRDADAMPNARGEVPVTLRLVKNRNGVAGRKVDLRFHGALQRFREAQP